MSVSPVNVQKLNLNFGFDQFRTALTPNETLKYLETYFVRQYFSKGDKSQYLPLQEIIIMQQRRNQSICNNNDDSYLDCVYKTDSSEFTMPEFKSENCILEGCQEFNFREHFNKHNLNKFQYAIEGRYAIYDKLGHYFKINLTTNVTEVFAKLQTNGWIDENSVALVVLASSFDLKANQQIQMTLISEMPTNLQNLSQQVRLSKFVLIKFDDPLFMIMFFYFLTIVILISFRVLLELSYMFTRYALFHQTLHLVSLYTYILVHFYVMVAIEQQDSQELLLLQSTYHEFFDIIFVDASTAFNLHRLYIVEDFAKLIVWIIYPFRVMHLKQLVFGSTWLNRYTNAVLRSLPGLIAISFLIVLSYLGSWLPNLWIDLQYRIQPNVNEYWLYIFTYPFLERSKPDYNFHYSMVYSFFQYLWYITILIFTYAVVIESFRKGILIEFPWQSKYEKQLHETIEEINSKNVKQMIHQFFFMARLLKEITKIITKEKSKGVSNSPSKRRDFVDGPSQILNDEELMETQNDRRNEKILIVYEIHNAYLDEINRYKEKKDTHQPILHQKRIIKKIQNTVGSIISSLLQKNQQKNNQRLKVMLSKYCNSQIIKNTIENNAQQQDYSQINEEADQDDFIQEYHAEIEDNGVIIRSFCVLDQVIKFLGMLLKLRPEFLSLNAEQRIRVFFFINSEQIAEEDVFKMLSFLIVHFKKAHLTFPVLVFSHHKDWYIEKGKYLTLKKFYKNIYCTLDKECALQFSLMQMSFLELQARYSKEQQFQAKEEEEEPSMENEEIQNSFLDDQEQKSEFN